MSKARVQPAIRLRGVRHNNLKNFDLDLPLGQLIVITGLSGSGKSSLAFDTLFAEGQRRYIETFSPYARQFFDRMDKPQVDSVEGIPPAIAIEQRNTVRTTRSTVGTMTEICDYLKTLWPHLAHLHCRGCGKLVRKESPAMIWQAILAEAGSRGAGSDAKAAPEVLITFDLPLAAKLSWADSLALVSKQGYQRLLVDSQIIRLDDALQLGALGTTTSALTVIQDRLRLAANSRARFVEACEQAYHFGKGRLAVREFDAATPDSALRTPRLFSNCLHCAACDLEYRDPSPALFSFNHPLGACPTCKGFGRVISIDFDLAVPDRSLTLAAGAVKPWRGGFSAECQDDLRKFCQRRRVPMDTPFAELPQWQQDWVLHGDEDYGSDGAHQWPHAWYGVKGYFKWLESKAYKMHVRVLLSRYRAYTPCPDCQGQRLQPDALLYLLTVPRRKAEPDAAFPLRATEPRPQARGQTNPAADHAAPNPLAAPPARSRNEGSGDLRLSLADFYALPIRDSSRLLDQLAHRRPARANDPLTVALDEVRARLGYLNEVGLGYLTLDRPTRSLSGGETERVNLTTCLGTRLVNTLFVLDEPSVGLHPRDTDRLVHILQRLRDAGNTVVVVEHEASVMRAADQIIDLGPGHGATGGAVVFQGPFPELLRDVHSLTGQYLSARRRIELPRRRPVATPKPEIRNPKSDNAHRQWPLRVSDAKWLILEHASRHNLKDLTLAAPLNRFVCLTGVSGSGKTTLAREVLVPALEARVQGGSSPRKASDHNEADDTSDAEPPAVRRAPSAALSGWEHLHQVVLVDQSPLGKTPRSNPAVYIGAFDDLRELFAQSEAARQRGLNASAFSFNSAQGQCERCRGAGFEKIEMQFLSDVFIRCPDCGGRRYRPHILEVKVESRGARADGRPSTIFWSIADLLDATVDEVMDFLAGFGDSKPARRASASLQLLQAVGLGYLRLGQPINTLSGGESQRLKLVSHLAQSSVGSPPAGRQDAGPALFIFDEPTTGLHFDDVRVLLQVFQRLVEAGHSLLVIEHNLDVIKCADWVIDLGPEAGDEGGRIVAEGTPEHIAACADSHTGRALHAVLKSARLRRPGGAEDEGRARERSPQGQD